MSSALIFDGIAAATALEQQVATRVAARQGRPLVVASLLFTEDQGSVLYTRLKAEAAARVGIGYKVYSFSMTDDVSLVIDQIRALNQDPSITGIIIQKPGKQRWQTVTGQSDFAGWWRQLVTTLEVTKDVDGLHPTTLAAIKAGEWRAQGLVLPATASAVLKIIDQHALLTPNSHTVILGKSDIMAQPLFFELSNRNCSVEMIGSAELAARVEQGRGLRDADLVVSATGRPDLVTGELLKAGTSVIDVGEPKGDVHRASVEPVASFLTPVPGGVGPMTVSCLLENAVEVG